MKNLLRPLLVLCFMLGNALTSTACITCNRQLRQAIFDSTFYPNLLTMLSAFIALALIVGLLAGFFKKRYAHHAPNPMPLLTAALVLGIGLGGFVDGIVLHQILQWHEMLSAKLPPTTLLAKSVNMFWDGVFHAFCLVVTLIGLGMLWKVGKRQDASRSGNLLAGGMLAGWGIFNIVEGVIDHQILKLHNVREITDNVAAWNFGFLGFSVVLLGAGWALVRRN